MITIHNEKPADVRARETLLDAAYGRVRFTKPSEELRRGRVAAEGLSLIAAENGCVIGTVRLWHVHAGEGRPALLLGPLAVHPDYRCKGLGAALMERVLRNARMRGHAAVLLVGDADYYGRFGFSAEKTGGLTLPGGCLAHRLLALELSEGVLDGAAGTIVAAGKLLPGRTRRVAAAAAALQPQTLQQASRAA